MTRKKSCKEWIKEHNTELVVAGICVGITVVTILGIRKAASIEDTLEEVAKELTKKVPEEACSMEIPGASDTIQTVIKRRPHDVKMHLRNLPEGHKASIEKVEAAMKLGIVLLPEQTWVDFYRTKEDVA